MDWLIDGLIDSHNFQMFISYLNIGIFLVLGSHKELTYIIHGDTTKSGQGGGNPLQ